MQRNGRALEYAAKALKADREVVLAAVQQDGGALIYAAEALQADHPPSTAPPAASPQVTKEPCCKEQNDPYITSRRRRSEYSVLA